MLKISLKTVFFYAVFSISAFAYSDHYQHDPISAFEEFWQLYDEHYALFESKRIDWSDLRGVYRQKVSVKTTRQELFQIFNEALTHLNDVHVSVKDLESGDFFRSGGRSIGVGAFDTNEFSLDLIEAKYALDGTLNARMGGVLYDAWLGNDIAYVYINRFKYPTSSAQAMDVIMDTYKNSKAMIVDVRQNGGGRDSVAMLIAGRFVKTKTPVLSITYPRSRNTRPDSKANLRYLNPNRARAFTKPVYVLINSRTISAAENFVLAMREIPHCKIVGETTAGAFADTTTVITESGWRFTVPINVIRDARGRSWEGVGLAPDLWIKNSPKDIQNRQDRVLTFAHKLASID